MTTLSDITRDTAAALLAEHVGKGNRKLGTEVWTYNLGSAHSCPSAALGLCEIPRSPDGLPHCYAWKDEQRYPDTLAFRQRQGRLWRLIEPDQLAECVRLLNRRARRNLRAFRFSVAHDVHSARDIFALDTVAEILAEDGIPTYCYTARIDLAEALASVRYLCVNGSGRRFRGVTGNTFTAVPADQVRPTDTVCPGDCRGCDLCMVARGLDIVTPLRHR